MAFWDALNTDDMELTDIMFNVLTGKLWKHTHTHTQALPLQGVGVALEQVGVVFCLVNVFQGVCPFQANH